MTRAPSAVSPRADALDGGGSSTPSTPTGSSYGQPVAFAPTRREVAVRQCHIFRLRDGMHAEHISVRDDLAMMTQLGHLPPSAAAIARMARWTLSGRARRATAAAIALTSTAAREVSRPSRQDA
jgi:hypothetical protein